MNVVVTESDKLQSAVAKVVGLVPKSESNPVQTAIKVTAEAGRLLFTAVDTTSHQITLGLNANIQVPGEVLVEADYFGKVINKLGSEPYVLSTGSGFLNVKTTGADIDFPLFNADIDDFPAEKSLPAQVAVVAGEQLTPFIKGLSNGVLFKEQEVILYCVGTDQMLGYVGDATVALLIKAECALKEKYTDFQIKIPNETIARLPQFQGDVVIHMGEGLIAFASGDEHLLIRSGDTDFEVEGLDYIFDKSAMGYLTLDLRMFRNKIGTLKVAKQTQIARLKVIADAKLLRMSAHDTVRGRSNLEMGAEAVGETPSLLFDANCLEKAAHAIQSEVASMGYIKHEVDNGDVWVIKMFDEAQPTKRQAIVLPIDERSS